MIARQLDGFSFVIAAGLRLRVLSQRGLSPPKRERHYKMTASHVEQVKLIL